MDYIQIFAKRPWQRCRAFRTHVNSPSEYWGRCNLIKNHPGDHCLERGMVLVFWSTEVTEVRG